MADWIRTVSHLSSAKVAQRLAPLCKGGAQHAAGVLQDFWSSAADHSRGGYIRDMLDETLEDWARWKGKRGAFAKWVREFHMDADGRINDWDEFMGELELRREKARLKKARQRAARRQNDHDEPDERGSNVPQRVPGPVPGDNEGTSPPYVTERDVTGRNGRTDKRTSSSARENSQSEPDGRQLLLDVLGPSQRKAMAASLDLWAQGYELPNDTPKRAPTDAEMSRACREAAASVQGGQVSANLVRRYIATVMKGDPIRPEKNPRSNARGAAGWDEVK